MATSQKITLIGKYSMKFLENGICPKCNLNWNMEAFDNWAYELAYDLSVLFEDHVALRCPQCSFEEVVSKGDLINRVWGVK